MSEPLTLRARVGVGLFGKLPARGDFVRLGLPDSFVAPWDAWCQRVLAGSRERLGAAWLKTWLGAPVWRFALPAGQCGPNAALGLILPSVDRVGRYFPLTLAMVAEATTAANLLAAADHFLAAAEKAGLAALERDLPPDAVRAGLASVAAEVAEAHAPSADEQARWWRAPHAGENPTDAVMTLDSLPDPGRFTAMICA